MKRLAVLLAVLCMLAPGCGDDGSASAGDRPQLIVSAATSLKKAFTDYGATFDAASPRFSFAGSDDLAAQIRQGSQAGRLRGREHEAARSAPRRGARRRGPRVRLEPARDRRAGR